MLERIANTPADSLLIDQNLEDRFIRSVLHYEKMLMLTSKEVSPDNFSTRIKADLWKCIATYWDVFEKMPTTDLLIVTMEEMYGKEHASLLVTLLERIIKIPVPEWSWILAKIDGTVKGIKLHKALFNASAMLKNGNVQDAESALVDTIRNSGILSETTINDLELPLSKLNSITDTTEDFCFPTRIHALDDAIKGIHRRELFMVISPMNVGKSWAVIHLAISALLSGKHVLYLTLEMSRERVLQRIMQNISGTYTPKNSEDFTKPVSYWNHDYSEKETRTSSSLLNSDLVQKGLKVLKNFGGALSVKEYPSATCTINDVEKCAEMFDISFEKVPDLIIVDGLPDIKQPGGSDPSKYRLSLTHLTRELRRISSIYNCAVVSTHQANREAINAKLVGSEHTSESIGIVQVADTCISLNQTKAEYQLGKLRINIMRARNQKKWGIFEVFQNLEIGQFCQISRPMEESEIAQDSGDDYKKRRRKKEDE